MRRWCLIFAYACLLACAKSTPVSEDSVLTPEQEIEDHYGNPTMFRSLFGGETEEEVVAGPLDPKTKQGLFDRGEYLVSGPAACGFCHSSDGRPGTPLSGGRLFQDRFGVVRAANITPSKETGIGNWTRTEIIRAIRASLAKDDAPLSLDLHATYRWMSDSDVKAIAVYLQNIPPVESLVERRVLGSFEKNRMGLFSRYHKVEGFIPAPPKSKSSAYGRYLAYHVAGCYGCHTPEGGIVDDAVPFSGTVVNDRSFLGSFKSLFTLLTPKSEEESRKESESSLRLLSTEARDRNVPEAEEAGAGVAKSGRSGTVTSGLNAKYDQAFETGALPISGPDIRTSSESGIASWTKDNLMTYLASGTTPSGEKRDGRVCPWPYFRSMDKVDQEAIATFIKRQ